MTDTISHGDFTAIRMTPDELADVAKLYHSLDFPGRRPATRFFAERWLARWLNWLKRRGYDKVTSDNLQEYVNGLFDGYAPKTAKSYYGYVVRFLTWMERTRRVPYSPHHAVRQPAVRTERKTATITRDDYLKLREAAAGHWMDWIIMLGWNTGMSISDCMRLTWGNVDLDNCVIRITRLKSGSEAIIPFDPHDELGRALMERRAESPDAKPDDFVCGEAGIRVDNDHPLVSHKGVSQFRHIAKRAGLAPGKRFHGMRHAYVSMLANSGMSTALAAKVSGHVDPRVFARYVHPDSSTLRALVGAAKAKAGDVKEVYVEPHGQRYRQTNSYVWRPNTVYLVKGSKLRLPDGTPVEYVKSGPDASGKRAVCTPCDHSGEATSSIQLVVDVKDVRRFG